jgi:hypothetical protein
MIAKSQYQGYIPQNRLYDLKSTAGSISGILKRIKPLKLKSFESGGGQRSRTDDLLHAMQAL